jgi:hypothetical protein
MITASDSLKTFLKESYTFQVEAGCFVEYNWNQMTDLTDANVLGSEYWEKGTDTNIYPFKKLFPIDSIIKANRPNRAGIKYAIIGAQVSTTPVEGETKIYSQKGISYPQNYRLYYPGVDNVYKYWISRKDDDNQFLAIKYPKDIITNKIVIKFEISHSIPTSFSVLTAGAGVENFDSPTTIFSGTSSDVPTFSGSKPGVLELYYNGTAWSTTASSLSTSSVATIRGIKLSLTNITGYVGVIEISPRWVKDISSITESFSVTKDSSSSTDDIIPVGYVSSNSLEIALNDYNSSTPQMIAYKSDTTIESSKFYLYPGVELRPYIRYYHSNGASGSTGNKYDDLYQGYYYIDSWSDTDANEINVVAFDGARALQQIVTPNILCENYSIAGIIRRLLDSVGFTNYKFNYKMNGDAIDDISVASLNYWWTEKDTTVWQAIQELCRDTQMTAVFDESNILQFYTRDYMYNPSKSSVWDFRYETSGSDLANIESFNKTDIPTSNQVKVLWRGASLSAYSSNAKPLWSADTAYLTAGGLVESLPASNTSGYIKLTPVSMTDSGNLTMTSFSGYLAIGSEIIEYDAIEYGYIPLGSPAGTAPTPFDAKSSSDLFKYIGAAEPSSVSLKPTGRYKIKTRGAFGTTVQDHNVYDGYSTWSINEVSLG